METQQYKQIEDIIKALYKDIEPMLKVTGEFNKETDDLCKREEDSKLSIIISHLTKTARRHNIDKRVEVEKGLMSTIGTNHLGLGYQPRWSSQITPLCITTYYNNAKENERKIGNILFDEEAVIDLTANIKKSNQKTFMKVIKALRKYKLEKTFYDFKSENLDKIEIEIDENYKLIIDFGKYSETEFCLVDSLNNNMVNISMRHNDDGTPCKTIDIEETEPLKNISEILYKDLQINDIKMAFLLSKHKEDIIKAIKSTRKLMEGSIVSYREEKKELNELLEPILALEKL